MSLSSSVAFTTLLLSITIPIEVCKMEATTLHIFESQNNTFQKAKTAIFFQDGFDLIDAFGFEEENIGFFGDESCDTEPDEGYYSEEDD